MAAIGADAEWLVSPHPVGSAYGPGSPIERFLQIGGKVLSIGAPPDAVTVLHFAEAVADIPNKRRITYSMPLLCSGKRQWVTASDWDSNGILDEYAVPGQPDAVERMARDYFALGMHREGTVGNARTRLIDANAIVQFGIAWLEQRHKQRV
jgi:aminoglycoside 3-N-acetyltransferase-6